MHLGSTRTDDQLQCGHCLLWVAILVSLGLSAVGCGGSSPPPPVDEDFDGAVAAADCNDSNPDIQIALVYQVDLDEDGVGGPATETLCEATAPIGYSLLSGDCDDSDPLVQAVQDFYIDSDRDGIGSDSIAPLCAAIPPSGFSQLTGDCNDADSAIWQNLAGYADVDLDGIGAGGLVSICSSDVLPSGYVAAVDSPDNCVFAANGNQDDLDGDNVGDACDSDLDGDGVANSIDNCVFIANTRQSDQDRDHIGDLCDDDLDGDGILNAADSCPSRANANSDTDRDGIDDVCDTDWVIISDLNIGHDDFVQFRSKNGHNESINYTLGEAGGGATINIREGGSLVLGPGVVIRLAGNSRIFLQKTDFSKNPWLWFQAGSKIQGSGGKNRLAEIWSFAGRFRFEEGTEIDGIGGVWVTDKVLKHPTTGVPKTFETWWLSQISDFGSPIGLQPNHLVIKNSASPAALKVDGSNLDLAFTTFENNDGYPLYCESPAKEDIFPKTCMDALLSTQFIGNGVNSIRAGCRSGFADPNQVRQAFVLGPRMEQVSPPDELHLSSCHASNVNSSGSFLSFNNITLSNAHSFDFDANGLIVGSHLDPVTPGLTIAMFGYSDPTRVTFSNVNAMNLAVSLLSGNLIARDGSQIGTIGMTYRDGEALPSFSIMNSIWDLAGSPLEIQLYSSDAPVEFYGAGVTTFDSPNFNRIDIRNSEVIVDSHYDGLLIKGSGFQEPSVLEGQIRTNIDGYQVFSPFLSIDNLSSVTGASPTFQLITIRRALFTRPTFTAKQVNP